MDENPTTAEEQYNLGKKYILGGDFNGHYVIPDEEKAKYWLIKAAERGHFTACCELSSFYSKKDMAKSEYWHNRAIQVGTKEYVGRQTSSSGSKKWAIVGAILLLFVGIEVGIAVFFVSKLKEPDLADVQKQNMEAERQRELKMQTDIGATMAAPIEITVNINGEEGRYLKCGVQLEYAAEDIQLGTELEAHKARIKNIIVNIMSSKSLSDLMSNDGKKAIREQIVAEVNNILPKEAGGKPLGKVRRSYFDSFLLQ